MLTKLLLTDEMDTFNVSHEGSSEPESNATVEARPLMQQYIAFSKGISFFVISIVTWIFVSLVVNGVRKKKWISSMQNNFDGGMIYTTCVITVAFTLLRLVLSQWLFYPDIFSNCSLLVSGGAIAYGVVICQVYVFLWLRRRVICNHPNVSSYVGTCYRVTSYITLVAIFLLTIGTLSTYLILDPHSLGEYGCVYDAKLEESKDIHQLIPRVVLGISLITLQLSLLSLFVYPMWKLRRVTTSRFVEAKRAENHSNIANICDIFALFCISNPRHDILLSTIARSITGTVITIVTDTTVALLVSLAVPDDVPTAVSAAMYDFGLLICIFGVLMTFQDKRKIFFGFCFKTERSPSTPSRKSTVRDGTITNSTNKHQVSASSLALVEIT